MKTKFRTVDCVSLGEGCGIYVKQQYRREFGKGTEPPAASASSSSSSSSSSGGGGGGGIGVAFNLYVAVRGRRVMYTLDSSKTTAGSADGGADTQNGMRTDLTRDGRHSGNFHIGWIWISQERLVRQYGGRVEEFLVLACKALSALNLGRV